MTLSFSVAVLMPAVTVCCGVIAVIIQKTSILLPLPTKAMFALLLFFSVCFIVCDEQDYSK